MKLWIWFIVAYITTTGVGLTFDWLLGRLPDPTDPLSSLLIALVATWITQETTKERQK